MFELHDNIVWDISEENFVQVITDGASIYVVVCRMLEKKQTKLFWSPCVTHCIDFIFQNNGKIIVFYNTIAKVITNFTYMHIWEIILYRKYVKDEELARLMITRFATSFLTRKVCLLLCLLLFLNITYQHILSISLLLFYF